MENAPNTRVKFEQPPDPLDRRCLLIANGLTLHGFVLSLDGAPLAYTQPLVIWNLDVGFICGYDHIRNLHMMEHQVPRAVTWAPLLYIPPRCMIV